MVTREAGKSTSAAGLSLDRSLPFCRQIIFPFAGLSLSPMAETPSHLLYVGTRPESWRHVQALVRSLELVDGMTIATEADRGLELLKSGGFAALLVDGDLERRSSILTRARRLYPNLPVVLIGGADREEHEKESSWTTALPPSALVEEPDATARRLDRVIADDPMRPPAVNLDDLDDGLLVFDGETGRVLAVNESLCGMHGYRRDELIGSSIDELFGSEPPYTPREIRQWLDRTRSEGRQLFRWKTRSKDGASVAVEIHLRHRGPDGRGEDEFLGLVRPVVDRAGRRAELEEQHRFRERALDRIQDLFFICTPEGEMVYWTHRAVEITGYTDEEISTMHPEEFVTEEDVEHVRKQLIEVQRGGSVRTEVQLQTREGRRIPYEFTGSLLEWNGDGYVCGVGRNVTERSRAVTALRRSERRYRRLFEDSRDAIAITTPEGAIIDANPAAMNLLGYQREEFPDLNATSVYVNPARREELQEKLEERGFVRDEEVRMRTKEGKELVCLLTMSVRRDENGHVEAYQAIFRDITERKEAERDLEESENMFRTLAEKSLVGVYLVQDGLFKYINPRGADMLDYEPHELIEKHGPQLITHPEDWPLVAENLQRRLSGEEDALNYSFRAVTKHGEIVFVEVYGVRITYRGRPAILGTALDQTERKQLEQELVQVQEEERRRISQDLHDGLASKLSGIEMMTRTLARRAADERSLPAEQLEEIADEVHESNEEVHRLAEGLNPIQVQKHGLSGALRELAAGSEKNSDLDATFEVSGSLPELDEEVATHLYRVAQEAVENATRHAGAERLDLRLEVGDQRLTLAVEDDGAGFDPSAPRRDGLGIHTMQYRADLIGGELLIDPRPSGGTIVRCTLPRTRAVVDQASEPTG